MSQKIKYNKEQVVVAKYSGESRFRVPEGIDIQAYLDSGKAYVRWNILYVELGDDTLEIECHQDAEDNIDWKRGDEVRVEDRDEDFDKEDEEEESKWNAPQNWMPRRH